MNSDAGERRIGSDPALSRPVTDWSGGGFAAERAGENGDEPALDLVLGLVAEFHADGCQHQPVQQACCAAYAKQQLLVLDARNVWLDQRYHVAPDAVEPRIEPSPPGRWVDPNARDDAHDIQIPASHGHRADH